MSWRSAEAAPALRFDVRFNREILGEKAPAACQHPLGKRGVRLLQSKCPACTKICENEMSRVGEA
jgi:hypothetical protein